MKKKIVKLSAELLETLSDIKNFKKVEKRLPRVVDLTRLTFLSRSGVDFRVNKLLKLKKIVKNKKGELSIKK